MRGELAYLTVAVPERSGKGRTKEEEGFRKKSGLGEEECEFGERRVRFGEESSASTVL